MTQKEQTLSAKNHKTILLVDDEMIIAMTVKMTLEKYGYKVLIANSVEEAVAAIEKKPAIDLILMDINLGAGIDGTEAALIILRQRDLPVVFLSSHMEPEVVAKTEKITSYGYVVKNSSITVLDASIKMAFKLFEAKTKEKEKESQMEAALEALRESEVRLKAQYQGMPIPTFTWLKQGEDFELIDFNDAAKAITHEKVIEFVGRKASDLYANRQDILRDLQQCFVERKVIRRETLSEHFVPGKLIALTIVSIPSDLVMVHMEDITERRRAESQREAALEGLRKSEEKYRGLTENISLGIYRNTVGPGGKFIEVNPAIVDMFGYESKEEFLAKNVSDLYQNPEDRKKFNDKILKENIVKGEELWLKKKDGSLFVGSVSAVAVKDEQGQVKYYDGIIENIDDRKLAESQREAVLAALRVSEERYRALVENASDLVYRTDKEGNFTFVNRAAVHISGYEEGELIGKLYTIVIRPDMRVKALKFYGYQLGKGIHNTYFEIPLITKDGREVWLGQNAQLIIEDGQVTGFQAVARDITERKRAEEEIKRQLAEKVILLKEVHHRIKNNIASIGGLISLHKQSVTNPEAAAVLQDAIGRVNNMRILYDKLLLTESYKDISVKNYVESLTDTVVALFPDNTKVTLDKRIVDFNLDSKLLFPLGIIINELLTNIMKYAFVNKETGLIQIALKKEKNHITLTVQDNGIGFPAGLDIKESKGFGLMLVKMLSQQMGGSFLIKKHKGTKCTFEFNI